MARRLTAMLIAARWWLLVAAVMLAILAAPAASRLSFDRSIESMFAPDDPLLPPYEKLKRTFGGNEIVMAVYEDPDLMTPSGLEQLETVGNRLGEVPGVAEVLSWRTPLSDPVIRASEEITARFRDLFEGYTHNVEGSVAAVVCMLEPEAETDVHRRNTIDQLRAIISDYPAGTLAGEPVMVVDGFRYIEQDGARLGWTSSLLLMATIALCFRSLRWVIIPLAVVQLTLLITRAVLVRSGLRLSMVSSMLTAIVTVVGVATVVHIIVRFRDGRWAGLSPRDALLAAGAILAGPIFWACSTDAVGFASLLTASVGPIQDFGVMMLTGALLVMLSVALLVPGLGLLGPSEQGPRRAWGEGRLDAGLQGALNWVEHHPRTLLGVVVVAAGAVSAGGYRLQIETDFTKNFRSDSPVVQSYQYVEAELGGAGVWDVILPAPEQISWKYVKRVLALEDRLRREVPELTKVLSLADAVEAGAPVSIDSLRLGFVQNAAVNTAIERMRAQMPTFTAALYGQDPQAAGTPHHLRIMLRAPERQPAEQKLEVIEKVRAISHEEFAKIQQDFPDAFGPEDEPQVTGFFVLLTNLIATNGTRSAWLHWASAS